jgi:hypothetical protein
MLVVVFICDMVFGWVGLDGIGVVGGVVVGEIWFGG